MADIRLQLAAMLEAVAEAVGRGADPEEVAGLLYEEDAVVLTEGDPTAIRGLKAFMPNLTNILNGWGRRPTIKFTLVDPVLTSDTVASSFLDFSCLPDKPGAVEERYRVLYGWRRGKRGWRVVLEMVAVGSV